MHVVHLVDKFRDGGAHGGLSTVVAEETRNLVRLGHRMTVIARRFHETTPLRETVDGVDVMRFDSGNPAETFMRVRGLVHAIAGRNPIDVLHSHLAVVDLAAVRFLPKRVPVVRSFHGDWPVEVWSEKEPQMRKKLDFAKDGLKFLLHERIERMSMRHAKKVHVLSDFSKRYVMKKFGRRASDIVVIPPGIDLERFSPVQDKAALRAELQLPREGDMLLFAGRLIAWKGPARIVSAFAEIAARHPQAFLVIAGSGREETALRAQANELGIADRVHFVGFQQALLPRYYAAADAVIVASTREETFGMVTAEALACGTPVLGTPFGATPEILEAIDAKLLFNNAGVGDIAERLDDFLQGAWRAPITPERLRDSVASRYSWNTHSDRVLDFYRTL